MTGVGFGLMYIPAIVAVAEHFHRRRSLALGKYFHRHHSLALGKYVHRRRSLRYLISLGTLFFLGTVLTSLGH